MENVWDIQKIQEVLPQKYPFLFIDNVLEIDKKQEKVICLKNVTVNDYFFKGHFPGNPILPGAIIIEAMSQASIILFSVFKPEVAKKKPDYYLAKVESRFLKPVRPGDQLILEAKKEKMLQNAGIVKATAKVNDEVVAEAHIMFGVKQKDEK